MLLLSCSHLSRAFDRDPLFEDLGFELFQGERVGIVGPNGAGKTTLMRILAGLDQPDSGDVRLHAGAKLMLLEQQAEFPPDRTLFAEARSAFDELLRAQDELVQVAEQMSVATDPLQQKSLSARFDQLNELLSHNDAFSVDHKVAEVLGGLGFKPQDYERPLGKFSGGQQRRLLLAKLLLANPEVMLLDEPSNHLDINATRWLENYLAQQSQAMLIVSHDRYFLNRVVNKVFELSNRTITSYPGNFNQYVRLRQERYEQQLKEFEAQQEYIEKQEEIIRRMHYGQMAKMAQSRKKALDKVEVVERPVLVGAPQMHFGKVVRAGDIIFHTEDLCKSFGEKVLFENLNMTLERGKRLGIMGPNGVGKTTLLKILLGEEKPTSGAVKQGALVEYGYLDQHLKMLDEDKSIIRAVWPEPDPEITVQKMRDLLGRFGLAGKIIDQPIRDCSGGERSRAALARLVVQGANVLILDEPTNHLDIWACDALEEAIKEFEGTVIVVSHDRYFLNRIAELLIVMEPGRVELVYGNYDTYELLRTARENAEAEETARKAKKQTPAPKVETTPSAVTKSGKKKRKFPYRKVADLENDIAQQETVIAQLEEVLASAEVYRDANKFSDTMKAHAEGKEKLAQLYAHWEEAVELNNE